MNTCDFYVNPFADDDSGLCGNPAPLTVVFVRKSDGIRRTSYRCEEHATDCNNQWEVASGVDPGP